ncbi:MAG: hypothetical protein WBG36_08115 [Ornithinimicrobium sp.]
MSGSGSRARSREHRSSSGSAAQEQVDAYFADVPHAEIVGLDGNTATYLDQQGIEAVLAPTDQDFWAAAVAGSGTQELTWPATPGRCRQW